MMQVNKIYTGDCLEWLRQMPDNFIDCCVTSPPYYGLRDYGTAEWAGGDEGCDHIAYFKKHGGERADRDQTSQIFKYNNRCGKCGATSIDNQIGLEETPDAYVSKLVEVFREVKRVLKKEGTLWLNIGDSYSNGMPDFSHFIHRSFEQSFFFIGNGNPIRPAAERINVLLYDKGAPNLIFFPLLGIQSILIKEGNNYFSQIGNSFNSPINCYFGISSDLFFSLPPNTNFQVIVDKIKDWGIITTASNLDSNTSLETAISFSKKSGKASFAIEVTGKPVTEIINNLQPVGNAIIFDFISKSGINIYSINQPVSFSDTFNWTVGNPCNFFVIKASFEQLFLFHKSGGLDIAILSVAHLYIFKGGLIPYLQIYANAKRDANEFAPKNEIGIPDLVKRALKRDGWICRQTIIWAKPNPMPESVTDRCTKSHEYIFLLSKSQKYYYDADAIKQPMAESSFPRLSQNIFQQIGTTRAYGKTNGNFKAAGNFDEGTANKRSVWTVTTKPFSEAHFATFPEDLVVDCIKAGCPEFVCNKCGKARERVVEKSKYEPPIGKRFVDESRCDKTRKLSGSNYNKSVKVMDEYFTDCNCNDGFSPGIVLDPFSGAGTTALVAKKLNRNYIGIELNETYVTMANHRLYNEIGLFL